MRKDIKHPSDPLKRYSQVKAVKSRERAYQTWLKVASPETAYKLTELRGGLTGKSKRAARNRGLFASAKRYLKVYGETESFWGIKYWKESES